jgi:hypothetical protein
MKVPGLSRPALIIDAPAAMLVFIAAACMAPESAPPTVAPAQATVAPTSTSAVASPVVSPVASPVTSPAAASPSTASPVAGIVAQGPSLSTATMPPSERATTPPAATRPPRTPTAAPEPTRTSGPRPAAAPTAAPAPPAPAASAACVDSQQVVFEDVTSRVAHRTVFYNFEASGFVRNTCNHSVPRSGDTFLLVIESLLRDGTVVDAKEVRVRRLAPGQRQRFEVATAMRGQNDVAGVRVTARGLGTAPGVGTTAGGRSTPTPESSRSAGAAGATGAWATCEIVATGPRTAPGRDVYRTLEASCSGPSGRFTEARSQPLWGEADFNQLPQSTRNRNALEELRRRLEADGWEADGRGADWFSLKFRRRI